MRFTCKCLNRPDNNIAVWMAIYVSILFTVPNRPSNHHHPIAASIAAVVVILAAGIVAGLYRCNRRTA